MKLQKNGVLILQFNLGNPRLIKSWIFFKILISDNKRLTVVAENQIRRDHGKFSK